MDRSGLAPSPGKNARADRSRFFSAIALLIFFFIGTPALPAATPANPELEHVLQKIESRHYRWIAIRSDVLLFFAKAGDPSAMCGGELLYQRLDERMLLTCVDAQQELLFIFRTFDRRFDLYLPSQNTVYHGSIFDMEDSPDIESHLKARDLYRALKPTAVDPRRTRIERTNFAITSLNVYGRNENEGRLARKLYLTPEGDVRGELFYDPKGRPVTEIQRYDFRELGGLSGPYGKVLFPKKVTITSPETKKGSAIFFMSTTAPDTIDPLAFMLRVPPGTREVFLDDKDPLSARSRMPGNELRPLSEPERSASAPRVDLARKTGASSPSPQKISIGPRAASEERSAKRAAPTIAIEKTMLPESLTSPERPAPAPLTDDPDADIAPTQPASSDLAPSTSNPQTTLDPSVQPSLEMGLS